MLIAPQWVALFRKGRGNALLEGAAVAERMRAYTATQGGARWMPWRLYLVRQHLHFEELVQVPMGGAR